MADGKFDEGKPRMDLIDPHFELDVAKIMTQGVKVHGEDSWKTVPGGKARYLAAMKRHINAIARGEIMDKGTGLPHTACIGCNTMFLHYIHRRDGG